MRGAGDTSRTARKDRHMESREKKTRKGNKRVENRDKEKHAEVHEEEVTPN